jgi:glycosyltransferase involved in cell wall biosynthesis
MAVSDAAPAPDGAAEVVDVSVLIPTIGRSELLEKCLRSLEACRPRAREIVIIDQSDDDTTAEVVSRFEHIGARNVRTDERGVARARNQGLQEVSHEVMALTDDDCIVDPSWIGLAHELATASPGAILTGRVLPGTDEGHVPSTRTSEEPVDFTGTPHAGAIYTNNAVVPRSGAIELGGFDVRFPNASDNDFGYRWLVDGRPMRFDPRLVVWHNDWRTPAEVRRLYMKYGRWQGAFYAKHLIKGDRRVLRFLRWDIRYLMQVVWRRVVRREDVAIAPALLPVLALPLGLWESRRFRRDD